MTQPDLVLLHPPSVFDFRERPAFDGPLSDVIPSSPVFEMYPVGFLTLAAHLRRHGYRTRIVNLALLMMRDRGFQPARYLAGLRPALFGLDLHWLPHAQGGPAVAALLKDLHPAIPIVFGGLSASYFHRELIDDPAVDFVLRGSVGEPGLLALLRELRGERRFERVPGLTWKSSGQVHVNAPAAGPEDLDAYAPDLGQLVAEVAGRLDFWSSIPYYTWWRHPITAVFTVRGCARGCVACGAAAPAFPRFLPGHYPLYRSPEAIADQVQALARLTRAPIFLVGDLSDRGPAQAHAVVAALARRQIPNRVIFEFYGLPAPDLLARIDAGLAHWSVELSPESHDEQVRARLGKADFTNLALEAALTDVLARRCEAVDLFYMIGLPGQTLASALETVDAVAGLFARFDRRLSAFITPLGPFLDPGSAGFEAPAAHGYRLRARTLAEHRALLEERDWEARLNYETEWMTRAEIVEATYAAAERLNELKARTGRISPGQAAAVRDRLAAARQIRARLRAGPADRTTQRELAAAFPALAAGTLNDKAELFPPAAFLRNFRLGGILRLLAGEALRGLRRRPAAPGV